MVRATATRRARCVVLVLGDVLGSGTETGKEPAAKRPNVGPMTAPRGYDPYEFPPFAVTADVAVLTTDEGRLRIVLVQRAKGPYEGRWALPGGFVDIDEDLEPAAVRELREETGIVCDGLTQLGAYGNPGRDPRMRVVTVVFWAHVAELAMPVAGDDAADAHVWDLDEVLADADLLAFDHHQVITDVRAAYEASR